MNFIQNTLKRNNFSSFVKDQKVALVGPANYLKLFEFGEKINTYDLTARVNRGMELVEKNSSKIGSKTDILFNCLIEHNDNGGFIDIKKLKRNNVKWVCTIPRSDFNGKTYSNRLSKGVNYLTKLKLKYNFNLHIFDYKEYGKLNQATKCRTNTGFSAIFDLLYSGVKEIYITGFSFYMDSFMEGYKKGCDRDEDKFAEDCFSSIRHDQINQWKYLKSMKNNQKLTFDPVLDELLKKDNLKRAEFPEIIKKVKYDLVKKNKYD